MKPPVNKVVEIWRKREEVDARDKRTKVKQTLAKAHRLVELGWVQGDGRRIGYGSGYYWCVQEAIATAARKVGMYGPEPFLAFALAAGIEIEPRCQVHFKIMQWNDEEGRTYEDVDRAFNRARKALDKAKGG